MNGGSTVVVKFPLASQAGRKLIGLLNAVKDTEPCIHLYTNLANAGDTIGDRTLDKAQAYLNMRLGDKAGEKVTPTYCDEQGQVLMDAEKNVPAGLPMGVQVVVNRKTVWDFGAADDVAMNTAFALVNHFHRQAEGDSHADGAASQEDEGINLAEAAAAAAPRG